MENKKENHNLSRKTSLEVIGFAYGELPPSPRSPPPVRFLKRRGSSTSHSTTEYPIDMSPFTPGRQASIRFTDVEVQEPQNKLPAGALRRSFSRTAILQKQARSSHFLPADYGNNVETGEVSVSPKKSQRTIHVDLSSPRSETSDIEAPAVGQTMDTSIRNLNTSCDVEFTGRIWRRVLQSLICATRDEANVLRITRVLQASIPFQTSYEAYVIGELIAALRGDKAQLAYALSVVFQNRNVTRVLIRNMLRWDILFHQDQQLRHAIFYDAFGVTIGLIGFPVSENFVNTRNFTIASILRLVLGEGHFVTRFLTGRQALITDNPNVAAQNLAAEGAGFETANRAQWGKKNTFKISVSLLIKSS
jgi:hypothetical protein